MVAGGECLASLHEKPKQIASALWAEKPKNDNKELRKFIDDCFKNYQAWWNSHAAGGRPAWPIKTCPANSLRLSRPRAE